MGWMLTLLMELSYSICYKGVSVIANIKNEKRFHGKTNLFFNSVHATLHPALSVRPSVGLSVTLLLFYQFYSFKSFYVILEYTKSL